MAYNKLTWVEEVTPTSAANLNRVEQGVADAHSGDTARAYGFWYSNEGTTPGTYLRWGTEKITPNANYFVRRPDLRGVTVVKTGLVMVEAFIIAGAPNDGRYDCGLHVNGAFNDQDPRCRQKMSRSTGAGGFGYWQFSDIVSYAAGDYLGFMLGAGLGAVFTPGSDTSWVHLSLTYLGAVL